MDMNTKRIALCLYGYFNNKTNPHAGIRGYQYIKENILDKYVTDVYLHSWDADNDSLILSLYNPISCTIETQIDFNPIARAEGIDEDWINGRYKRKGSRFANCTVHNSLSFFYSRSQAIWHKCWGEIELGIIYDYVIVCRFDLGQRSGVHRGFNVSKMPFDPKLSMEFIYSAMWDQLNAGYADQWFFSNSANIDKLGTMYSASLEYLRPYSFYFTMLTGGWPESNSNDEFSNERLGGPGTFYPVKYPRWQMINNHILHKWHFIQTGLYEKSKFLDGT